MTRTIPLSLAHDARIASLESQLQRALDRIEALERALTRHVSIEAVSQRMTIEPPPEQRIALSMRTICTAVAEEHGIPLATMKDKFGPRHFTDARAEFCRLARMQGFSFPQIGRFLGGRDHTSIMHLCRRSEKARLAERQGLRMSYTVKLSDYGGCWWVVDAAEPSIPVSGHVSNQSAWRAADKKNNEVLNRPQASFDWAFTKKANGG